MLRWGDHRRMTADGEFWQEEGALSGCRIGGGHCPPHGGGHSSDEVMSVGGFALLLMMLRPENKAIAVFIWTRFSTHLIEEAAPSDR